MTDEGKEKKMNLDFAPFKPINTSLYLCDNKFHTEALDELLQDDERFGFIVMDGNGTLYGTLQGRCVHRLVAVLWRGPGHSGDIDVYSSSSNLVQRCLPCRRLPECSLSLFSGVVVRS